MKKEKKLFALVAVVAAVLALALPVLAASPSTLVVAPGGSDSNACTASAPCATISHAVQVASAGDTVWVKAGTYKEQVTVTKPLTIEGEGLPTVDASGQGNGFLVKGAGAAGTTIQGFIVENATYEGILLLQTTNITVRNNVVRNNDQGMFAANKTGECAPQGKIPGDCGEGLHLMSTSHSTVVANLVQGNAAGILLTDEMGPTDHNVIKYNNVLNNLYDCGITLASHSPKAFVGGKLNPSAAGVFDNQILYNTSANNGTRAGAGAGVLMAAAMPGAATYHNLVEGNTLENNAHAGVTIHSHAPGQYLEGNVIKDNDISHNAVDGGGNMQPGDDDAGAKGTIDVLVWSAVQPITGTVIEDNRFSNADYGIWTGNTAGSKISGNQFTKSVKQPTNTH